MLYVLEQFELAISALAEHGRAERFHDLLDRDGGSCELIFGGAGGVVEHDCPT